MKGREERKSWAEAVYKVTGRFADVLWKRFDAIPGQGSDWCKATSGYASDPLSRFGYTVFQITPVCWASDEITKSTLRGVEFEG